MQFKRIRLAGFKSFVDPTEMWIEPGLTGVVGPNGCGKSNILEAVRWVMGESSPKSMRGGGMEDVIFAGTASRPARNIAEVSLLLDNRDRKAPAAFNDTDELEVSRRIEREMGSVYRVNGKDVRQKDVQLLFADAATGAHSPSLVSQGRVGALINAKPQARRQLLEEAAGISGLHARRKEAEQKLRAAENNLTRLADVLAQMESQVGALKRQARQARRYKELSGEIRIAEALALYTRWKSEIEKLAIAEQELKKAEALVADLTGKAAALSARQADMASELPALRQAEAEAAAALSRLQVAKEALDKEEIQLAEQRHQLEERRDQAEHDLAREAEIAADSKTALDRLADERARLEEAIKQASANQDEAAAAVAQAEQKASEAESQLDNHSRALANAEARKETLEGAARAARRRLQRIADDKARLAQERKSLLGADSLGQEVTAAEASALEAEKTLESAAEDVESRGTLLQEAESTRENARIKHQKAQSECSNLSAEIAALDAVLAESDQDGGKGLSDYVTVAPGYERALGAALGDDLDAPLNEGRRYWQDLGPLADIPSLPEGAEPLALHVEGPKALLRRLSQIGVITANDAERLTPLLRPGQRLVSREGALWRWDGYRMRADVASTSSIRLAQRNRRNELVALRSDADRVETTTKAALNEAEDAVARAAQALATARQAEKLASQILGEQRRRASKLAQDHAQRISRVGAVEAALARLDAESEEASGDEEAAAHELAHLPNLETLATTLEAARETANAKRAGLIEARGKFDRLHRDLVAHRERAEAVDAECQEWTTRIESTAAQREKLTARKAEAEASLAELAERPAEIEAQRQTLMGHIAEATTLRREHADRLAAAEKALAECDREARALNETLTQARERRVRVDAERESHGERAHDIAHDIDQAFQCRPQALFETVGIEQTEEAGELDALEEKLEKLKAERERLGAVNLRAEIELTEINEQLVHLTNEKSDLESAIARLRAGVGSLNREGRERLLAAFAEVNAHFSDLFKTLFGGGQAHLELVESDDPLEAGLEIMASPPGKRLQTLSLLSGGEQALTALSLIFAVFMTNPAPICVLDEVDAPLDDANVDRFCNLLDEMTRRTDTRFLIVTHNAVTMSRVDRLFGVTMAERGVSQLVSVDLAGVEELRAAE